MKAKPPSEPLLREPTAGDWTAAVSALRAGNGQPAADILRMLDLPIVLVKFFAAALEAESDCKEHVAADRSGELPKLRAELALLERAAPSTVADAQSMAERQAEVEHQLNCATNAAEYARVAGDHLDALHRYFPQLFGLPQAPQPLGASHVLPKQVVQALNGVLEEVNLNPHFDIWPEAERAATIKQGIRRRIVAAANVNSK